MREIEVSHSNEVRDLVRRLRISNNNNNLTLIKDYLSINFFNIIMNTS